MTTTKAKRIAKLILKLADSKNVHRDTLENEIAQIVRNVHEDYAPEIIQDLEFLDLD